MRVLVVCLCFVVAANALFVDVGKEEWQTFKLAHSKHYKSHGEEKLRMKIFMDNKITIAKHNEKYAQGLVSYKMGINQFSDLLEDEFNNLMNGFNRSQSQVYTGLSKVRKDVGVNFDSAANSKLPTSVDWREKGAVTPVKYQGACGSCWSFSATGALEGRNFIKTGKLISLSEQNLIDCSAKYGNHGCRGGLMDNAFNYIKANGGIDTEESYPYEGSDETCRFDQTKIGATDIGYVDLTEGDEANLMEAVSEGPVSVAVDSHHNSFHHYNGGIYDEPACSSIHLTHGVLVVGYGTENGIDYWLVKNSWSTNWGEEGYVKMVRNNNNQCGIATRASYPKV